MTLPQLTPALLIIDMQKDFTTPGTRLCATNAIDMIPAMNRMTHFARINNVPVMWVIQEHRRQLTDFGREGDISPVHCVEGTPGAQIVETLERKDSDYIVIKRRYSGFYCTDLDLLLRCLGCNTLVLCGILTDGCVQATAVDAQARDYYVRVIADLTATRTEADKTAALQSMGRMQPGVIINSQEAEKLFSGK